MKSKAVVLTDIFTEEYEGRLNKSKKTKQSIDIFNNQVKYESELSKHSRICHTDGNNSLLGTSLDEVSGINQAKVIEKLKTDFGNYNLMECVRCCINTIIDIKNDDEESERARIHEYIQNPKKFGASSRFNFALRTDIKTLDQTGIPEKNYHKFNSNMLVIKTPREPSNSKELIHEECVGISATNSYRMKMPFFSYVYSSFECGGVVIDDETNDVLSWCMNTDNPVSYVAYENIQNPISFGDLTKNKDQNIVNDTLMYLFHIAIALCYGDEQNGFVHGDCHNENVILREYSNSPFYFILPFNGVDYAVPCPGRIPTFIDYGMSRVITNDGVSIGKLDSTGRFANIGFPHNDGTAIADIHKLLCFMIRNCLVNDNNNLLKCLCELLGGYFYSDIDISFEDILYIIENQFPQRYHVAPDIVRELKWEIHDFTEYLNEFAKIKHELSLLNTEIPPGYNVFGQFSPQSETFVELKKELEIEIPKIPSLFDLSELPNNEKIKENVLKNLDVIIQEEWIEVNSIVNDISGTGFYPVVNKRQVLESMDYLLHGIDSISKITDNVYKLISKMKVYDNVEKIVNTDSLSKLRKCVQKKKDADSAYIKRIRDALDDNFKLIKEISDSEGGQENEENKFYNLFNKYDIVFDSLKKLKM